MESLYQLKVMSLLENGYKISNMDKEFIRLPMEPKLQDFGKTIDLMVWHINRRDSLKSKLYIEMA